MFLVRYDAQEGQQALAKHTDESFVSFNILLNEDFEGGGTRFHNRRNQDQVLDIHPTSGHVLLNNAVMLHEGLPTKRGTRYILVGFLQIDRNRPISRAYTGLSWFASWLSLPWAQVRFKQGYQAIGRRQQHGMVEEGVSDGKDIKQEQSLKPKWSDSDFTYLWYSGMASVLGFLGDAIAPHKAHWLVEDEKALDYITALDAAPLPSLPRRASWFSQQRLITDVDGSVVQQWNQDQPREQEGASESSSHPRHDPREL
jgi:hypothetical protein